MMPAGVPGDADADLVVGAADPGVLGGVELRRLVAEQRIEAGAAADGAERGAVLRRRRCRASWRAAGCRRPPCSSAPPSDCRGCACPCGARACARRGRSRRRRCSRCRARRSCPCRNRPALCAQRAEHAASSSRPRANSAATLEHARSSRRNNAVRRRLSGFAAHYPRRCDCFDKDARYGDCDIRESARKERSHDRHSSKAPGHGPQPAGPPKARKRKTSTGSAGPRSAPSCARSKAPTAISTSS